MISNMNSNMNSNMISNMNSNNNMISNINFTEYKCNSFNYYKSFFPDKNEKKQLGIVYTSFYLVQQIMDIIPINEYKKINHRWLDAGSGLGSFTFILYEKLLNNFRIFT